MPARQAQAPTQPAADTGHRRSHRRRLEQAPHRAPSSRSRLVSAVAQPWSRPIVPACTQPSSAPMPRRRTNFASPGSSRRWPGCGLPRPRTHTTTAAVCSGIEPLRPPSASRLRLDLLPKQEPDEMPCTRTLRSQPAPAGGRSGRGARGARLLHDRAQPQPCQRLLLSLRQILTPQLDCAARVEGVIGAYCSCCCGAGSPTAPAQGQLRSHLTLPTSSAPRRGVWLSLALLRSQGASWRSVHPVPSRRNWRRRCSRYWPCSQNSIAWGTSK